MVVAPQDVQEAKKKSLKSKLRNKHVLVPASMSSVLLLCGSVAMGTSIALSLIICKVGVQIVHTPQVYHDIR